MPEFRRYELYRPSGERIGAIELEFTRGRTYARTTSCDLPTPFAQALSLAIFDQGAAATEIVSLIRQLGGRDLILHLAETWSQSRTRGPHSHFAYPYAGIDRYT